MTLTQSTRVLMATMALGCGAPATAPKSPTNDAEPPATTTGNGEVMGADGVSPAQKMEQGPKIDSHDGVQPAPKPPSD